MTVVTAVAFREGGTARGPTVWWGPSSVLWCQLAVAFGFSAFFASAAAVTGAAAS